MRRQSKKRKKKHIPLHKADFAFEDKLMYIARTSDLLNNLDINNLEVEGKNMYTFSPDKERKKKKDS